jgi:hypothetical protein
MKRLTTLFILCFVSFPLLHSCVFHYGKTLKGNHQIVNETIDIDDYDAIALHLSANVIYRQIAQEAPFLQVSVDENLLSLLDISVVGKRLIIKEKEGVNLQASHFVIYTNSRSLRKVSISGSGDVALEKAVNAQEMDISITGSGDLKSDSLYCERLNVAITGSGDVELKGAATDAQYTVTGSGDVEAFDFLVEHLDCRISGSGNIHARVDKKLYARISGSGDIRYVGDPESVDRKVSGSGSVRKAEAVD